MKAVVYKGNGIICLEERPLPEIQKDTDAIVKVTMTTICSSDIHIKRGAVPRAKENIVLGHEFVGEVIRIGKAVKRIRPGDRVAVNVETFCGKCYFCRHGYVNNCTDKYGGWALGCRIDGGQAEYVRIPYADNGLTRIPETVSDEAALFTGDLLSTGYWAAKMGDIKLSDTVAVIGAGPAGIAVMKCVGLYNPAKIIGIDMDEQRLDLLRQHKIADVTLNPLRDDVIKAVKELTDGRGADSVLEVAGSRETFEMAWMIARPNAVVGIVAMYEEDQVLPLPKMYGKNLTFKTGGVDAANCEDILRLIENGRLNTECMITHRTTLDHIMEAYDIFEYKRDGVVKYAVAV
ncbi:Zn-dependent alcohol dehydrogenase [Muricomes sp. OA1]|uniref:Zn-dependent alcohol dehydrogenase n=1 Tax=Hungatella hathewayi TaxID=154046 RepID=A0A3E2WCJ5_9FIRM|nr:MULTISPECIES: Zn-dependent alcohol dehydrogenase [Clostridia]MCH1973990.1 Zn-dependent alcohol dehydrogenase [Muricomes sp. OA1]MRM87854.1 Zn-dependent alcohol dehydrogenase [Faecalicatena contorta]RGC23520.1 Zn-dependent alcohol dehydrogenase [Hungatella hathewayi]GKH32766.1 Zn-dependent alcohol dehydrogenase [Faecalicatena contorta]